MPSLIPCASTLATHAASIIQFQIATRVCQVGVEGTGDAAARAADAQCAAEATPAKQYEGLLLASLQCVQDRRAALAPPASGGGSGAERDACSDGAPAAALAASAPHETDMAGEPDAKCNSATCAVVNTAADTNGLDAEGNISNAFASDSNLDSAAAPPGAGARKRHFSAAMLDAADALPVTDRPKVNWRHFATLARSNAAALKNWEWPEGTRMLGRRDSDAAALNAAFAAFHTPPRLVLLRPREVPVRTWARLADSQQLWYSHADQFIEHARAALSSLRLNCHLNI